MLLINNRRFASAVTLLAYYVYLQQPDFFLVRVVAFLFAKIKIGKTINLVSHFEVMCLKPLKIVNPSKYISLKYRDRFLLNVPCGHCAECQQTLSNQWLFRTWVECQDVISSSQNSFIYFDSLSYSNKFLPHMSDIIPDLPYISCFRSKDLRNFLQALRQECLRKYSVMFRYFVSSEYGHDNLYIADSGRIRRGTIRPHYHCLFFVYGDIKPLDFSRLVSRYWKYGNTDGVPFSNNNKVLNHNTIYKDSLPADFLRATCYVTKYVQKSCVYNKMVNDRLNKAMFKIAEKMPEDWLGSPNSKRVRMKLARQVALFHRQSQKFGASYLRDIDLQSLFNDGVLWMPSTKGIKLAVPIPDYYKRLLFYDLVTIDGTKSWQLNELGKQYNDYRHDKLVQNLADIFYGYSLTYNLGYDLDCCKNLAIYVYDYQGRIKADKPSDSFKDKLNHLDYFNYVTLSDKEHLDHVGIVDRFLGNNSIGYNVNTLPGSYSHRDFIKKYCIYDEEKEKQLSNIYFHVSDLNDDMQNGYELKQRLQQVYKEMKSSLGM